MRRILFVCHGNICRSQMAQSIASYLVGKNNLESSYYFDSAATSREEIGAYMYPPAVSKLNQHRIPVVRHKARQITDKDLKSFDEIYYMDSNNLRNLRRMFSSDSLKNVHPMLDRDISDPWQPPSKMNAFKIWRHHYNLPAEGCQPSRFGWTGAVLSNDRYLFWHKKYITFPTYHGLFLLQ